MKRFTSVEKFKSRAVLRGFGLCQMWVLSIPSFAFAVVALNATLTLTILHGFLLSCMGIVLSVVGLQFVEKKYFVSLTDGINKEIQRVQEERSDKTNGNRIVIEFALLFVTLVGSILIAHSLLSLDLLTVIPFRNIVPKLEAYYENITNVH
jgi:hypothetical protein